MSLLQFAHFGDSTVQNTVANLCVRQRGAGSIGEQASERIANLPIGPLVSSGFRGTWLQGFDGSTAPEWSLAGLTQTATTDPFDKGPHGRAYYGTTAAHIATWTWLDLLRPIVGFAVYWIDFAIGGNWQFTVDGGTTWLNMNQALLGNNRLRKFYVPLPITTNIQLRAYNGATNVGMCIAGIETFYADPLSVSTGVIWHNFGSGAQTLRNMFTSSAGDRLAILDSVDVAAGCPDNDYDIVVLGPFSNDAALNDAPQFQADLGSFCARVPTAKPVTIVNCYEQQRADAALAWQANQRAATKSFVSGTQDRETYTTGDDETATGSWSSFKLAQMFTPAASHSLIQVRALLLRVGACGTVHCDIYATTGSPAVPTGASLGRIDVAQAAIDTSAAWVTFDFSSIPIALTAGVTYAIVIQGSGGNGSNAVLWRVDATAPSYAGGHWARSTSAGSFAGQADTTRDAMFAEVSIAAAPAEALLDLYDWFAADGLVGVGGINSVGYLQDNVHESPDGARIIAEILYWQLRARYLEPVLIERAHLTGSKPIGSTTVIGGAFTAMQTATHDAVQPAAPAQLDTAIKVGLGTPTLPAGLKDNLAGTKTAQEFKHDGNVLGGTLALTAGRKVIGLAATTAGAGPPLDTAHKVGVAAATTPAGELLEQPAGTKAGAGAATTPEAEELVLVGATARTGTSRTAGGQRQPVVGAKDGSGQGIGTSSAGVSAGGQGVSARSGPAQARSGTAATDVGAKVGQGAAAHTGGTTPSDAGAKIGTAPGTVPGGTRPSSAGAKTALGDLELQAGTRTPATGAKRGAGAGTTTGGTTSPATSIKVGIAAALATAGTPTAGAGAKGGIGTATARAATTLANLGAKIATSYATVAAGTLERLTGAKAGTGIQTATSSAGTIPRATGLKVAAGALARTGGTLAQQLAAKGTSGTLRTPAGPRAGLSGTKAGTGAVGAGTTSSGTSATSAGAKVGTAPARAVAGPGATSAGRKIGTSAASASGATSETSTATTRRIGTARVAAGTLEHAAGASARAHVAFARAGARMLTAARAAFALIDAGGSAVDETIDETDTTPGRVDGSSGGARGLG